MRTAALALIAIVTAVSAVAAPQVAIVRGPQGIMQPVGASEPDSFVLANGGTTSAAVTLVANGNFFAVAPAAFTLDPGTSITVTIQPTTTAAGFFTGSVRVFVAGVANPLVVPVRMFSGNQPAGIVSPRPLSTALVVSGLSGTPHSGIWNVTNLGNVTMQGMLTPDVPWIVPQSGIVNIAPQQNAALPFATDPAIRDAITPLGAIVTSVGMLYLRGTAPVALQSGQVAATVVDISKVSVVPSQPPNPAPGESIAFLPLVGDTGGYFSDVFFANRGPVPLPSNLQLFYTALGSPPATSLLADAGPIAAGIAAWFPLAPSSLFNVGGQTGTIQVRAGNASGVALAMLRGTIPDGVNRYITSMPVLRSDVAIAAGDHIVFAGVEKSAASRTDIVLQEAAGAAASYTIDFFDAAGNALAPSASGSILPFGSVDLSDAVPSGARSARVTNTSAGSARLTGFASVTDASTFDSWTIADCSRSPAPTTDLVLAVPAGAPSPSQFDAWIANTSGSPVTIQIGPSAFHAKSRAVRRGPSPLSNNQTLTLAAHETRDVPLALTTPLVHISAPPGAVSANGRLTTTAGGRAGAFGTGVPAIPSSRAAAAAGTVAHFFRANDVSGVSPPALQLAEVSNRAATVRVTVAFNFPAGSLVSAHVEETKDFDVAPGQMLVVPDLLHSVVVQRDSFGELINVVIDVAVVAGDGRVLSYLESVDASGDLTFTAN